MDTPGENQAHALGRWGEGKAARFLQRRGWTVLARNYRFGRREVDLVVRRENVVAFVEVKTRAGRGFGLPQEAITALKRREIEAVAVHYLARTGLQDVSVRFDALAIEVDREHQVARVEHVQDAWRPGWT